MNRMANRNSARQLILYLRVVPVTLIQEMVTTWVSLSSSPLQLDKELE